MKQLLKYLLLVLVLVLVFYKPSFAQSYKDINKIIGYCVKYIEERAEIEPKEDFRINLLQSYNDAIKKGFRGTFEEFLTKHGREIANVWSRKQEKAAKASKVQMPQEYFTVEALEFKVSSCPEINFISKKKYLNQFNKINLFYIKNEYYFPEWQIVSVAKKRALFMIQGTSLYDSFFNVLTEKIITSKKIEEGVSEDDALKKDFKLSPALSKKRLEKKAKEVEKEAALQASLPEFKLKIGRDVTGPIIEMIGEIITDKRQYKISGKVNDEESKKIFVQIDNNYIIEAIGGKFSFNRFTIKNEKVKITAIDQSGNETSKFVSVIVTGATPNFYALIIGNNDYQHLEKLDAAENDAREIGNVLENKYEFKVTRLYNATRKDIVYEMRDISRKLNNEDSLLIYYAGHGIFDQDEDEGYWLPVDAVKSTSAEGIGNAWITKQVKATKARHVLLLIDSCFAGSITKTRSASSLVPREKLDLRFIERKSSKKSRMVITSGGNEPVVDSDGGDHSWFAKKLLEILNENNDVIYSLNIYDELQKYVINNADQTPAMAVIKGTGHNEGEFFFYSKN